MTDPITGKVIHIIKADGSREPWNEAKLRTSLARSGATDEAIEAIIKHTQAELKDGMTTHDIYRHAYEVLHDTHKPVAKRYSLRRIIMNLGPTGFPFEEFLSKLMQKRGYEAVTGQMVMGHCVAHEVDVVAWDNDELIMCEAKFHNELGTKTDLKVALYVKARFDDLKDNSFSYGGKMRPFTAGWLVTNTKFTSTAIQYGLCHNLTMIGWNYPEKGNLLDLIEETGVINDLSEFII